MKHILLVTTLLLAVPAAIQAENASSEAQIRIELDQPIQPADTSSQAVVKIIVEAPSLAHSSRRAPVNLSIVLDRSGSMSGDRIEYARLAAIEAVRRLRPEDIFSLVTYDDTIETLIPAQNVRNLEQIEATIRAITPRGSTALYGGVNQGASELRKNMEGIYAHRILLLSDGQANVGPSSPAELEKLGRALAHENIAVTTIGVGLGYNEDLMTRLARASDGNTYFVEMSEDLPRILSAELGDVQNIFARNAVIRIKFTGKIRPLVIIGRDGTINGQTAEIPLHQLYGDQERFALVEIEIPSGAANSSQNLGQAEVTYENIGSRETITRNSPAATVRFSADKAEIEASANHTVYAEVLEARTAEARGRAIDFADQGRRSEAVGELRALQSAYTATADQIGDPVLAQKAAMIQQEVEAVEAHGIDNSRRKMYRASNHQTVNQQNAK